MKSRYSSSLFMRTLCCCLTILNFSLTFKEPPRNPYNANICRLIELIIKTIVENLPFIKPIKKTCPPGQSDNEVCLLARFEVDKDNFLDEKIQDILKSLRATVREFLKKCSSKEGVQNSFDSSNENVPDEGSSPHDS